MDAAIVIGFYAAVVLLAWRVRRFNLALAAALMTVMLVIALPHTDRKTEQDAARQEKGGPTADAL